MCVSHYGKTLFATEELLYFFTSHFQQIEILFRKTLMIFKIIEKILKKHANDLRKR